MQVKVQARSAPPVGAVRTPWVFTALLAGFLIATTVSQAPESRHVLYVGWVCIGLMGVLVAARVLRDGIRLPPELGLYWTFVVWSVGTGLVVSVDLPTFQQLAERIVQVGILITLVGYYAVLTRTPMPSFLGLLAVALLLVGYGTITGNFQMAAEFSQEGDRVVGTRAASLTANANSLGAACVWALAGVAWLWGRARRSVTKALVVATVPALLAGVMYSASRKAFVLVFVFAIAFLWFCYRGLLLRNLRVFLGVAVAGVAVFFFGKFALQDTMLGHRWRGLVSAEQQDASTRTRLHFYTEGAQILVDRPLTGVGLGQFRLYSEQGGYSHSEYVEILANTGLVGAALYFSMYVLLWRRLRGLRLSSAEGHVRYTAGVCSALLVAILVGNLGGMTHTSFNAMALFGGMMGFSCGALGLAPFRTSPLRRGSPMAPSRGVGPRVGQRLGAAPIGVSMGIPGRR